MTTEESKVTPKHLKYSLAMADVCVSEEVADLTLRILERLQDLGSNFSLKDACEIRAEWDEDCSLKNEKINAIPKIIMETEEIDKTVEEYGLFDKEHQHQQCFLYSVSDRTSSNNSLKIEPVYDGISTAVTQYKITDDLGSIWMQGTRDECERYLYGR